MSIPPALSTNISVLLVPSGTRLTVSFDLLENRPWASTRPGGLVVLVRSIRVRASPAEGR